MSKKRIYFYILFLWLTVAVSPAFIGQKADTTYIFRFALQKDKFYVPLSDNDMKLARLLKCIESNKTDIFVGNYNSLDNERENMRIAAIRANHVKSELIVRGGIKGKCFATENRATEKNEATNQLENRLQYRLNSKEIRPTHYRNPNHSLCISFCLPCQLHALGYPYA